MNKPRVPAPIAAVLFFLFASVAVLVFLFAPWQPKADFDIIGVLYLMQNAAPLAGFALSCCAALVALGTWIEAARAPQRGVRSKLTRE